MRSGHHRRIRHRGREIHRPRGSAGVGRRPLQLDPQREAIARCDGDRRSDDDRYDVALLLPGGARPQLAGHGTGQRRRHSVLHHRCDEVRARPTDVERVGVVGAREAKRVDRARGQQRSSRGFARDSGPAVVRSVSGERRVDRPRCVGQAHATHRGEQRLRGRAGDCRGSAHQGHQQGRAAHLDELLLPPHDCGGPIAPEDSRAVIFDRDTPVDCRSRSRPARTRHPTKRADRHFD